jgi:hypothetical protein
MFENLMEDLCVTQAIRLLDNETIIFIKKEVLHYRLIYMN